MALLFNYCTDDTKAISKNTGKQKENQKSNLPSLRINSNNDKKKINK